MKTIPYLTIIILALITHISKAQKLPIIDTHLHIETEVWWNKKICFPEPCNTGETKENILDIQDELTISEMDQNKVVVGVLSEYDFDKVLDWDSRYPGRFLKGVVIGDPTKTDFDRIENELKNGRLAVLGEVTSQYFNYAIDDPALDKVFALAVKYDVPVHVHVVGLGGDASFPTYLGNPLRVAKIMAKYPNLRIWLENAGWPFLDEIISLMYQYPQVYADVSTISWVIPKNMFYKYLKELIDAGLGKRIMYGSDQMLWPEAISESIENFSKADFLTEEQKRDIFYNNAARFFRLTEEVINSHHNDN